MSLVNPTQQPGVLYSQHPAPKSNTGTIIMVIAALIAFGLIGYGLYAQYGIAKGGGETAESNEDDKSEEDTKLYQCKNYKSGMKNYMSNYTIAPMVNSELRDAGYILKGQTKELGIPYYCKPRVPKDKSDKAGECDPEHKTLYYFGDDNDNFVMPENWKDNPNGKFGDYYFGKDDDGKVNGITHDEAAVECYNDAGCGTVYLPSCEIGYKYVSKKTLNRFVEEDSSIKEKVSDWSEKDLIFKDGEFKNHACVKVNSAAASRMHSKKPDEVDGDWKSFLDFSDVRTLNVKENPSKKESPARMAYFYKKSKATDSDTSGAGAAGKKKSSNSGGDYTLLDSVSGKNKAPDHVLIQYWTGNTARKYEEVTDDFDTPCDVVNAMTNKDDRETCEKLVPGWTQQNCSVRSKLKRVV